jgi:nitroimidazol reductase NimA-like FMN-containing flavoprotein (pyridoxamine 5'-phosphate oxidase superfamily)
MSQVLDHQGMEVLSPDECWSLLASMPVGRVAYVEAGEPIVLPVNHTVVGHRVAFRTARGALLHEALMDRSVAFEVDDFDPAQRSGWSVLVRGRAAVADDEDQLEQLGLDAWADSVDRDDWVVILPDEVTGRRIVHQD